MSKNFSYKDAIKQIKFYKNLLYNLIDKSKIPSKYKNNLNDKVQFLINKNFFANLAEYGIKGNELYLDNPNLIDFFSYIYYFKESLKYSETCNFLYNKNNLQIKQYISDLSSGLNPLFWIFASKKKKENVESAYKILLKEKNGIFVMEANKVFNQINELQNTNFEIIKNDYLNNKNEYKQILKKANYSVFVNYK